MTSAAALLAEHVRREKMRATIRKAIANGWEITRNPRDRVRRSALYDASRAALGQAFVTNDLCRRVQQVAQEMGAVLVVTENVRMFAGVRVRDAALVVPRGKIAAKDVAALRLAYYRRLREEGLDLEREDGRQRWLPTFQTYREEINAAFFDQARSWYWKQTRALEVWGLYALEGLSVREIAAKKGIGRDAAHRIIQRVRREMEAGQRGKGEETSQDAEEETHPDDDSDETVDD